MRGLLATLAASVIVAVGAAKGAVHETSVFFPSSCEAVGNSVASEARAELLGSVLGAVGMPASPAIACSAVSRPSKLLWIQGASGLADADLPRPGVAVHQLVHPDASLARLPKDVAVMKAEWLAPESLCASAPAVEALKQLGLDQAGNQCGSWLLGGQAVPSHDAAAAASVLLAANRLQAAEEATAVTSARLAPTAGAATRAALAHIATNRASDVVVAVTSTHARARKAQAVAAAGSDSVAEYNIQIWSGVGIALVLAVTVAALMGMDAEKDPLLHSKLPAATVNY